MFSRRQKQRPSCGGDGGNLFPDRGRQRCSEFLVMNGAAVIAVVFGPLAFQYAISSVFNVVQKRFEGMERRRVGIAQRALYSVFGRGEREDRALVSASDAVSGSGHAAAAASANVSPSASPAIEDFVHAPLQ